MDGTCTDWTKFVSGSLARPSYDFYFSYVYLNYGFQNYITGAKVNNTHNCSSTNAVSMIVTSIVSQSLSPVTLYNQVTCRGSNWQVFLCGGQVTLCVDCSWVCSCPSATTITINSCGNGFQCYANTASYSLLWFGLTKKSVFPQLKIISVSVSRTIAQLSVNMSAPGRLFCMAGQYNVSISSPFVIKQYGTISLINSAAQISNLTLIGLSPSTVYDVYCYAEDLNGFGMDLTTVLKTKKRISTKCCPKISFSTSYATIPPMLLSRPDISSYIFQLSLDAIPKQNEMINITTKAISCDGSYTVSMTSVAAAYPSSFSFYKGTTSLSKNFIVNGTSGCYKIIAYSGNSFVLQNTTATVNIYSTSKAKASPKIQSATFSSDGSKLLINFDSATNYGVSSSGNSLTNFACSEIVVFTGASAAVCSWSSNRLLVATIDGFQSPPSVGDSISLVSGPTVIIQAPTSPTPPSVALSTPKTATTCDDVSVDTTGSTGFGGRPWKAMQWSVAGNGNTTRIQNYLNTVARTTTQVYKIPRNYFSPGTLQITLTLMNFLGVSSAALVTMTVSASADIPIVKITGSSQVTIYRSQSLSLFAAASISSCANVSTTSLNYLWTVYSSTAYLSTLTSTSKNPRYFNHMTPYSIHMLFLIHIFQPGTLCFHPILCPLTRGIKYKLPYLQFWVRQLQIM